MKKSKVGGARPGAGRPVGSGVRNWKGMVIPRLTIIGLTKERSATGCAVWLVRDEFGAQHTISGEYLLKMPSLPLDKFEFEATKLIQEVIGLPDNDCRL